MAKRKDAMALFEAISQTKAKPGGQVLPPHVGISPQPAKAESRAVLYVSPTDGGETAEPGAMPPPPPTSSPRGTWVTDAQARATQGQPAGAYESATERAPESSALPVVIRTPAAVKSPASSAAMPRSAVSAPPTTRSQPRLAWPKPRLAAVALAMVLLIGAVWYLAARSGQAPQGQDNATGPVQAGLGTQVGQHEELPPPPSEFLPGKYYLVVEDTAGDTPQHEQAAVHMANWLTDKGVPAVASRNPRLKRWVVIAYQRFDEVPYSEPVKGKTVYNKEATDFAKKIEGLGKDYFRQYRTYQFKQTNRNGEFTPSYVRISGPGA